MALKYNAVSHTRDDDRYFLLIYPLCDYSSNLVQLVPSAVWAPICSCSVGRGVIILDSLAILRGVEIEVAEARSSILRAGWVTRRALLPLTRCLNSLLLHGSLPRWLRDRHGVVLRRCEGPLALGRQVASMAPAALSFFTALVPATQSPDCRVCR